MDITALSMSIKQINQASSPVIGTTELSKCLENAQDTEQREINMMLKSITPNLGNYIDMKI